MADYPSIDLLYFRRVEMADWQFENLAAPYWRLYWNQTPGWVMRYGAQEVALNKDQFWVIPPETAFTTQVNKVSIQYYMHFLVEGVYERARPGFYGMPAMPWAVKALKSVMDHDWTEASSEAWRQRELMQLQAVLSYALMGVPVEAIHGQGVSEVVQRAMNLMDDHLESGQGVLSNSEVAEVLRMNVNAYIRRFKQEVGQTPKQWLMERRIAVACRLLHHSDESIEEIAEQTGFYDRYHFSREFTKLRRLSPVRYRKQLFLEEYK